MAEFPQLPIHVQRWLSELSDLSLEEHGVYFLAVMHMWLQPDCGMPNDPEWLRKRLKADPRVWRRLWPFLLRYMTEIDGRFYQKTLCQEREYLREKSAKGKANATTRWKAFRQQVGDRSAIDLKEISDRSAIDCRELSETFSGNLLKNKNTVDATQHRISDAPTPTPTQRKKGHSGEDAASSSVSSYAFEGKLIRLTSSDLERWRKAYSAIPDIEAELTTLDAYYDGSLTGKDRKNWFIRCSSALDKKHQERVRASKTNGPGKFAL